MSDDNTNPPMATARSVPPATTLPSTAVAAGTRIMGTYEIEMLISKGGMGEVYRGRNIHTGDPVAIKIVLPHLAQEEMIVALFQKEAKVLGRLGHDAIVRYHVFTSDPAIGRPSLVMEFVEGTSMNERMKQGPMTPGEVRVLLRRLASGLDRAHSVGVVHRDLSPDNVILSGGIVAEAKIIDFGIAKSSMKGDATLLQGQFAGKFGFVAPEQLGAFGGNVDARTDIYSLALMMVAASQGKVLNMGKSIVEAVRARGSVPDLSMIDASLRPLLEHMLEPDPAHRPASMAEVIRLLDNPDDIPSRHVEPSFDPDRTVIAPSSVIREAAAAALRPGTSPGGAAGRSGGSAPGGNATTGRGSLPVPASRPGTDALLVGIPGSGGAPAPAPTPSRSKGGLISVLAVVALGLAGAGAYVGGVFDGGPAPAPAPAPAETPAPETPAAPQTPAAETPAPQTPAAETPAPQTPAAETPAAETPAPQTPAAGTPAPTGTAAPATAPETDGGQDPAPGTPPEAAVDPQAGATPAAPAATAEPAAPEAPAADDPLAVQAAFVDNFDAGACTFLDVSSAAGGPLAIQAYGTSVDPFARLLREFTAAHGVEPDMAVNLIDPRQCDILGLMSELAGSTALRPRLVLQNQTGIIKTDEAIVGRVEGLAGRSLYVFIINGLGKALNLTDRKAIAEAGEPFLVPQADGSVTFSISLPNLDLTEPMPMLVFALATDRPVPKFTIVPANVTVQTLAPFMRQEFQARRESPGIAVAYFRMEKR